MSEQQTPEQEAASVVELRQRIAFGMDAKVFARSALGRWMVAKANQERDAALEALAVHTPTDPMGIMKLQVDAGIAARFLLWLEEAEVIGEQAEREFEARDIDG